MNNFSGKRWLAIGCVCTGLIGCGSGGDVGSSEAAAPVSTRLAATSTVSTSITYQIDSVGPVFFPSSAKTINDSGQIIGTNDLDLPTFWSRATGTVQIGTYAGKTSGVNTSGKIVGNIDPNGTGATTVPFTWSLLSGMETIQNWTNNYSEARDINNVGQIVMWGPDSGSYQTFLRAADGSLSNIGRLSGDTATTNSPYLVNDLGQVVGVAYGPATTSKNHVYFWNDNTGIQDITPSADNALPYALSDAGHVVGHQTYSGYDHAFAWTKDFGLSDVAPGATRSYATDVNKDGLVVGSTVDSVSNPKSYVWTRADGMTMLPTFGGATSQALAVDSLGQVVGTANDASNVARAFLWSKSGGLVDLNAVVQNKPSNLVLSTALAISPTKGYILVQGSNGAMYVLSPAQPTTPQAAPVIGAITTNDPISVGTTLSANAPFTDLNVSDTHTAVWSWGDGSQPQSAVLAESGGSGTVSGSHAFSSAGVYTVTLTVTDNTGKSTQGYRTVVVYDPAAGFVTGGGWITSPIGAYRPDPTITGRASFAFVSKYKKGATTPSGNTEFQFQSAKLNFHSDQYDWLVVGGARAQYKGTGTINGQGNYSFLLTAVDGNLLGKGVADRFRIKIWHVDPDNSQDVVDYDNQIDSSTIGSNNEGTAITSGNIVIQK